MLTERRKADRKKMASELAAVIIAAGGEAVIIEPGTETTAAWMTWLHAGPRETIVAMRAPGGAEISVDFDGTTTQPDVFVCTWNMSSAPEFRYKKFGPIGDVNPYHRRKATRVCRGFEDLRDTLENDVEYFVKGHGYEPLTNSQA